MKTLSVRQPYAWLIVNGYKTVENRSWSTAYRGPLLIHASRTIDREALEAVVAEAAANGEPITPDELRAMQTTGAIVGMVQLVDCTLTPAEESDIEWHDPGAWAWVLRNPEPFVTPIPAKGRLGLFEIDVPLSVLASTSLPAYG